MADPKDTKGAQSKNLVDPTSQLPGVDPKVQAKPDGEKASEKTAVVASPAGSPGTPPVDEENAEIERVKPEAKFNAMTTDVTITAQAVQHMPGNMAVVQTDAGQLIVPGVSFANGQLPAEFGIKDGVIDEETQDEPREVVVTAAYARSQSIV